MKKQLEKKKQLEERLTRMLRREQKHSIAEQTKQRKAKRVATDDRPVAIGALKMGPACQYLGGIHPATMRRLIERGLIRPNKVFRHLLFPVDELNRVISEGMVE
jgi:hypothetical protein